MGKCTNTEFMMTKTITHMMNAVIMYTNEYLTLLLNYYNVMTITEMNMNWRIPLRYCDVY